MQAFRFNEFIMAKRSTPKKQQSNSSSSRRYKAFQNKAQKRLLNTVKLAACPNCKEARLAHSVCPNCGNYKGKKVIDMEKKIDQITKVKA